MELQILQQSLSEYHRLLQKYADYQKKIELEEFRIMLYNNRTTHTLLGIFTGIVFYLFVYHVIINDSGQVVFAGLICFGGSIVGIQKFVGPMYDRIKRKQMKEKARLDFAPLFREMDEIALKVEQLDVLPEKYKTLHAVSHLLDYVQNRRVDSLKEGLNLYEFDLKSYQQEKDFKKLVGQQHQMLGNQKAMINQQRQMVRAQRTTNALLWFR